MKKLVEEYWFGAFLILIVSSLMYIIYVEETATKKPGCHYTDTICIKSHIETSERYYGKRWNTIETEICDEHQIIEVPCDCITRHYFWGDSKNY